MEVSSHALVQGRVIGCEFATAVFTNITQDHLDFHKTMESYTQAKLLLFSELNHSRQPNKTAVINLDDPVSKLFIDACGQSVRKLTYGVDSDSDIKALSVVQDFGGTKIKLQTPSGNVEINTKLAGRFNVYNLMAAIGAALAEGIAIEDCVRALNSFAGVPGRFEVVRSGDAAQPLCIVDYSHKPDALENVLKTARGLVPKGGQLIVLFGCGGDRDAGKRPKMGKIAEDLADTVIITSDNPRSENPDAIIKDIIAGISNMDKIKVDADRAVAIQLAINEATERDVVVIAGKGHETYQILADRTIEFDDRVKVLEALSSKRS
jgi:UDP-N-acetylmuramyl-tripeptide synthetase